MGFWSGVVAPAIQATYQPWSDFWFQKDPRYGATQSGITTSPEQSMQLGAVYACVRILADMVGYLPLHIYERQDDEGKTRATDHPSYQLLRRRPNAYQSALRWRQLGMRHILLRGNFYNLKIESTRRIQELRPLNPDRMKVTLLSSGRRGYTYRPSDGQAAQAFTQDEIFHVMGMSLDGITGCSVIEYARESFGRSLAEELYAARFWSQGAATKGALVTDGKLTIEQRNANSEAWQKSQAGWWNSHTAAMLEGGLKWVQIGVNARDAQYIEGRQFSVSDIARWFGVPPHMIGDVERSTSWGTGIEQQSIGFLNTTLAPWLTAWEQDIDRQLLDDDDDYYAEFLVDAMLRADIAARSEAQRRYVDGGIFSVNEVRIQENKNPIPGEQYDKPQRATNIGGGDPAMTRGAQAAPAAGESDDTPDAEARAKAIVVQAATRTVRKEIAAIVKWAPRYAGQPQGWREWVGEFYGRHVSVLEEQLGLDETQARQYGAAHTAALLEQGISVCEEWDRHAPAALTAMALGEDVTWPSATPVS